MATRSDFISLLIKNGINDPDAIISAMGRRRETIGKFDDDPEDIATPEPKEAPVDTGQKFQEMVARQKKETEPKPEIHPITGQKLEVETEDEKIEKQRQKLAATATQKPEPSPPVLPEPDVMPKPAPAAGTFVSPDAHKSDLELEIESLDDFDSAIIQSWKRGSIQESINAAAAKDMLTGGKNMDKILELEKEFQEKVAKDPEKAQGLFKKVVEMLPAMTKGAGISLTASAITTPLGGAAAGGTYFSMQGIGETYKELRKGGVTHETAWKISAPAGALYGAVEFVQIGKLTGPALKKTVNEVIQSAVQEGTKKAIKTAAKKHGANWAKNVGEEVAQNIIQQSAIEAGKQLEDLSDKSAGEITTDLLKSSLQTIKESAAPLAVLSLPGVAASGVKIAQQSKTIPDSRVAEQQALDVQRPPQPEHTTQVEPEEQTQPSEPISEPFGDDFEEQTQPSETTQQEQQQDQTEPSTVIQEKQTPTANADETADTPELTETTKFDLRKAAADDKKLNLDDIAQKVIEKDPSLSPEQAMNAAVAASVHPVSGISNQAAFNTRAKQIEESKKPNERVLYFSGDINNFKEFNDSFGESFGDEVLKSSNQFTNAFLKERGIDHFHPGGDEMAGVSKFNKEDYQKALSAMGELKDAIDQIQIILPNGKEIPIGVSFGVSEKSFDDANLLLKNNKTKKNSLFYEQDHKNEFKLEDKIGTPVAEAYAAAGLKRTRKREDDAKKPETNVQVQRGDRGKPDRSSEPGGRKESIPNASGEKSKQPPKKPAKKELINNQDREPDKVPAKENQTDKSSNSANKKEAVKSDSEKPVQDIEKKPEITTGDGKPTRALKKRRFWLFSQTGSVNPSQEKLPKSRTRKEDRNRRLARSYEAKQDLQDVAVKKRFRTNVADIKNSFFENFIQTEAQIARTLMRSEDGKRALSAFQRSRGASAWANNQYQEAKNRVYEFVDHKNEKIFARALEAARDIEVFNVTKDRTKKIKLPDGTMVEAQSVMKRPFARTKAEAEAYLEEVKKNQKIWPEIKHSMEAYWNEMQELVNVSEKEGLITSEFAQFLRENHKHYSPSLYIHHLDPGSSGFDGSKKVSVSDSGIKSLQEGSEGALLNDPRFLLQQRESRTWGRVFNNRANKELASFVEKNKNNQLGMRIKTANDKAKPNEETVKYWENGQEKQIIMPKEIAEAWVASDPQVKPGLSKAIGWAMGVPILKAGATGYNPEFAISNMARDVLFTWMKQHEAYSPVLPVAMVQMGVDLGKVAKDVATRKGIVKEYLKHGGGLDTFASEGFLFKPKPGELQGPIKESLQTLQNIMGWAGNTSELMVRTALMKRLMNKGKSAEEAAWTARTNVDFAQGGRVTKSLNNFIPYLNASIQGTRGVFQAFKSNPVVASVKAAQIIAFSVGLAYWRQKVDADDDEKIPDREKENGFVIPLPYGFKDEKTGEKRVAYAKIPKDHGQRVFSAIGESIGKKLAGGEVDPEMFKMALTDNMPVDILNTLPPTIDAMMTYAFNKDFFRKKDIWRGRKGISAKEEFWNTTPEIYKLAGKINLSPERTRAAFHKVVPHNMWTDALQAGYKLSLSMFSDKEQAEINQPLFEQLTKVPGARKILRITRPDHTNEFELDKKARNLGIKIQGKNKTQLKRDIKKSELKLNDIKIQNDRELDRIILKQLTSGKSKEHEEFFKKIGEEKRFPKIELGKELRRLSRRYQASYTKIKKREAGRKMLREKGLK